MLLLLVRSELKPELDSEGPSEDVGSHTYDEQVPTRSCVEDLTLLHSRIEMVNPLVALSFCKVYFGVLNLVYLELQNVTLLHI
jgi:hypothetical protein